MWMAAAPYSGPLPILLGAMCFVTLNDFCDGKVVVFLSALFALRLARAGEWS